MRIATLLLFAVFLAMGQEIPSGWFAFQTDARVAPDESLGSVAFLNPGAADRRITVQNGHFAFPDGTPVRFFGSNVTFAKAFPDKEVAPLLAKRMRQLGFNVLRFHHVDNRHIWNKEQTAFDPAQLDKLQWFIHCLNQNGIYANINLHVSWWYKGLDPKNSLFKYGKSLDRFYPPFIEHQKWYTKELLTAVSPYSHLPMTDDPGIFCIEINNENAIVDLATPEKMHSVKDTPWGDYLLAKWRDWLAAQYGDAPATVRSWQSRMCPYGEANMVENIQPSFEGAAKGAFEATRLPDGSYEFNLLKDGPQDWSYQVHFKRIALKETSYVASFQARCDRERTISVSLAHAEAPWHNYSVQKVGLTKEWQDFEVMLEVKDIQDYQKRFTINIRGKDTPAKVYLRNVELHEGEKPLPFAKATSWQEISLPTRRSPACMVCDYRRFLHGLDFDYSREMHRYLKEELKVKSLVADTQASYGGPVGQLRESTFSDFVDMHTYWQHPYFETGHPWSPFHWKIANTAMADDEKGGYFPRITVYRTAGKPYTISEFDHASPSEHLAEMLPMMGSYAAFQDWDALYQFCFSPSVSRDLTARLAGYFDMSHNPAKMVTAHFAAVVFRLGLVPPAETRTTITVRKDHLWSSLQNKPLNSWNELPGYPARPNLAARTETVFTDSPSAPPVAVSADVPKAILPMESPCITWRLDEEKRGLYLVDAPAAKAATGHLGVHPITLGDVALSAQLPVERTAAFTLVALDAKAIAHSRRMLLSLVGTISNVGMEWDEKHTTVKNKWGNPPAISNFIPAEITLPGAERPTITALDPAGLPIGQIQLEGKPGAWSFRTLPGTPTLWFFISR